MHLQLSPTDLEKLVFRRSTRYKPIDNHHAVHPLTQKKDLRKNINSRGEKVGMLLTKTTANIPEHVAGPLVATGVPSVLFVLLFVANAVCCAVRMIPITIAISVDSTFFILTATCGGKMHFRENPNCSSQRKKKLFVSCV
jgi:hypothetical protein